MKKFLPYILILVILAGISGPITVVNAQRGNVGPQGNQIGDPNAQKVPGQVGAAPAPTSAPKQSEFENQFNSATICYTGGASFDVGGCLVAVSYYLFYVVPSWLLTLSANFFDYLISISLSSTMFATSTFIPTAWTVVRDLSNIFFILILLYIAFQLILDIGGHDAKKMIVKVIVIALLINFSMFFTQVVIDSSNILALIFYNKLDACDSSGKCTPSNLKTTDGPVKSISGSIVKAFNPTSQLTWDNFFKAARDPATQGLGEVGTPEELGTCVFGGTTLSPIQYGSSTFNKLYTREECSNKFLGAFESVSRNSNGLLAQVPSGIMLGLILVTGAVMLFATYAFFIAGLSFMGRFIELWILIIFSPFALMSFSVPFLEKVEYIGWDAWLKRLFAVSFMAPIFMFFMYFIFLLLQPPGLFGNLTKGGGMIETMLSIVIPAAILLILLLQATKFAKKGSGAIGEKLLAGAKMVGGLALGAATGGAAMALRGTVGHVAANVGESNKFRDWAAQSRIGRFTSNRVSGLASGSFDMRKAPGVGTLAKKAGMNLDSAKAIGLGPKEGFAQNRAAAVKKTEEFVNKQLDTGDYGVAQLTRGNMSVNEANRVIRQMQSGGAGLTLAQQNQHRIDLTGTGMRVDQAKAAARHLNEARRNDLADRMERRTPGWGSNAQRRNATKRMASNRIRKSSAQQAQQTQLAQALAALAAAQAAAGTTPTPPPTAPPAPCWVAEVLYGVNDQRTHAARLWAATNKNWFIKLYTKYGKSWAKWLTIHKWGQPIVKPIWDIMAIKGQLFAIKVRGNEFMIDNKFDYLLEKVK